MILSSTCMPETVRVSYSNTFFYLDICQRSFGKCIQTNIPSVLLIQCHLISCFFLNFWLTTWSSYVVLVILIPQIIERIDTVHNRPIFLQCLLHFNEKVIQQNWCHINEVTEKETKHGIPLYDAACTCSIQASTMYRRRSTFVASIISNFKNSKSQQNEHTHLRTVSHMFKIPLVFCLTLSLCNQAIFLDHSLFQYVCCTKSHISYINIVSRKN